MSISPGTYMMLPVADGSHEFASSRIASLTKGSPEATYLIPPSSYW